MEDGWVWSWVWCDLEECKCKIELEREDDTLGWVESEGSRSGSTKFWTSSWVEVYYRDLRWLSVPMIALLSIGKIERV